MSGEVQCPACGQVTLLLKEPVYEGFSKVGEKLSCAGCGHEFEDANAIPYVGRKGPKVFTERDRSATLDVFDEHEADRLCGHCAHYAVNPFRQWCGQHRKEVEATDSCDRFEPVPPPEEEDGDAEVVPPPKPIF